MNRKKELAKFFSGVAVSKVVTFIALGTSNLLPLNIWFYTLTPQLNFIFLLFWGVVGILLIYYAWFKK